MKYNLILKLLRALIYVKRAVWWLAGELAEWLEGFLSRLYAFAAFLFYKTGYLFRLVGLGGGRERWVKRDVLQPIVLVVLLLVALPQATIFAKDNASLVGQKTLAYNIFSSENDLNLALEEVSVSTPGAETAGAIFGNRFNGVLESDGGFGLENSDVIEQDLLMVSAGGSAIGKPILMPGAQVGGRIAPMDYLVEAGDTLSSIAYKFEVNVATLLWENKITATTKLKLGMKLSIPPASGIMHLVKKGDNVKKIATLYKANVEDVVKFNNLKEDGSDLRVGEKIMIPGGVQPYVPAPAKKPVITPTLASGVVPPSSSRTPSASGFVWPSAGRVITQYYNWRHHAIDIAGGGMGTPIYAAKSGTVEVSQCGWNGGYGCYIILNHGNGVKTIYGHNSQLLVGVGEEVSTGQTISLMGNTGNVRGVTGIHLHFEIVINGGRVNPLGYVR